MTASQRLRRLAAAALAATALCSGTAACGDSDDDGSAANASGSAEVKAPAGVADAGTLVFCSDISYPPLEFRQGTDAVGADIDLGTEIARRMGVEAQFDQTGFDGIVAALLSRKCDAIASGMTVTPEREQQLAFVKYLKTGQAVIVQAGNPEGIGSLDDLSGRTVAVQVGTSNKDYIEDEVNPKLEDAGKDPIELITFPQNTDAVNALRTGRVDAYFADGPPVAYLVKQQPDQFELAGEQVGVAPFGIALRKDDEELRRAMQEAIDAMYADGSAQRTLAKWGLGDSVLKPAP